MPTALRRHLPRLVVAVALVALSARVSVAVPGSSVPVTAQSLAVLLVGAWLGPARGAGALVAYVVVGALGAPVFADGGAGLDRVRGPAAGFFAGFVVGAAVAGALARRGWARRGASALGLMALGTVALVLPGLGWLALIRGGAAALATGWGLVPGALLKAGLGAIVLVAGRRWFRGRG